MLKFNLKFFVDLIVNKALKNGGKVLKKDSEILERGAILIFIAGSLWGTIGLFIHWMSEAGASAEMISFLRMAFAFVILTIITVFRSGFSAFRISKKAIIFSAALGIICHGIYNIFYSWAVMKIGVTISAVLLNVAPVFTAILSAVLFREKITSYKCIALIVNIIGCVLAVTGGHFSIAVMSLFGILCGIMAGFCYALTAIFGRIAGESSDPFVISTYSYLFAALFLAVFLKPWAVPLMITPKIMWLGFFYALIPTAIGYLFYYQGVNQIKESSKVPVIASVETVVTAILGALVLGEKLSFGHYLGIAVVMISIIMMQQKQHAAKCLAEEDL